MNTREGLKNANKAKSGQIGLYLFKDSKPNNNKKFGYKKRAQSFPIRKVTTGQDADVNNNPASRQNSATTGKMDTRKGSAQSQSSDPKTSGRTDRKKTDFPKRNVQKTTGRGVKDPSTIALTQDQLNTILKSIGQMATIEIENGDLKVTTAEKESPVAKEDENDQHGRASSKNIMELLPDSSVPDPPPGKNVQPEHKRTRVETTSKMVPKDDIKTSVDKNVEVGPKEAGQRELEDDVVGRQRVLFSTMSLAEKKRFKWKQELDEQADLQRQQEQHNQRVTGRKDLGHRADATHSRADNGTVAPQTDKRQHVIKQTPEPFSPEFSPRGVAPSGLGALATQGTVPAAMRMSFLIGGQGPEGSRVVENNAQVKRRQQQEWLRELDQQRIDGQRRREQEKHQHHATDPNPTKHWAEPVVPPPVPIQQSPPRPYKQQQAQDDTALFRQNDRDGEVGQPRSAPPPQGSEVDGETGSPSRGVEERSHVRAHNRLLDPAEIERRQAQRVKHLEHMLAVKSQVEEKQRLKREAEERRRKEEDEEERNLALQRDVLKEQMNSEKDKQRAKEETEAARHRVLVDSMQAAQHQAQQQKHQQRLDKLAKMGHDVSSLRRSWEDIPQQSSPKVEQPSVQRNVMHSLVQAPSKAHQETHRGTDAGTGLGPADGTDGRNYPVKETPLMKDAFTSPVYDQAVQTECHFSPREDVVLRAALLERESTAGIEYKADRRRTKKHQTEDGRDRRALARKAPSHPPNTVKNSGEGRQASNASSPGLDSESRRRAVHNSEKPVWGTNQANKKLQKNSDKDLTVNRAKRDDRRRRRAAALLADQKRNEPRRHAEEKSRAPTESPPLEKQRTNFIPKSKSRVAESENRKSGEEFVRERTVSHPWTATSNLPDTPPLKNGDFVPFVRTDDPLMSEDNIVVTPESRQLLRHKKTAARTAREEDTYEQGEHRKQHVASHTEKDPLLNPERIRNSGQRQERILQQLSHLRQGLMMKQREMELGLKSPII